VASYRIAPENTEERLIFRAIVGGWAFYIVGALYIVGPALAIVLVGKVLWRHVVGPVRPALKPHPVPAGVWVWIIGMTTMLLALVVAHIANDLGGGQTLKSAIGWLKGWGLLALFPLAGACLRIRPELLVRASSWFALQTLIITPVLVAAALAHLPERLFVSPLQMVGGPGPEFFAVYLYIVDPADGTLRWQFIAPWAPAAGMLGNMIFVFACWEPNRLLKVLGLFVGVMIAFMTRSRMAMLFIALYPPILWTLSRLSRPKLLAAGGALSTLTGIVANAVITAVQDGVAAFRGARASSTRVREALGRIAVERWRDEAPVWGHGVVVRGSHYVEFMPIGSHHTWYGLLYVKGIVGLLALAASIAWTLVEMLLLSQVSRIGQLGLSICLMLLFYSFGENLEMLAYLCWPGLVVLGCAFAEAAASQPAACPEVEETPVS
jgi:ABC-type multidrug transport system fused ATPase/permease subunit